jgi:hypothetical protein
MELYPDGSIKYVKERSLTCKMSNGLTPLTAYTVKPWLLEILNSDLLIISLAGFFLI